MLRLFKPPTKDEESGPLSKRGKTVKRTEGDLDLPGRIKARQ